MAPETEKRLQDIIDGVIMEANKNGKVCGCGKIILDHDKTLEALNDLSQAVLAVMFNFAEQAMNTDGNLHLYHFRADTSQLH